MQKMLKFVTEYKFVSFICYKGRREIDNLHQEFQSREGGDIVLLYLAMIDDPNERRLFEEVYLKYRNLLFYISNSILSDEKLAEDAVHNTFLRLLQNMDKIEGLNSAKTRRYLVVSSKNSAIDLYRKRKANAEYCFDEINREVEAAYGEIDEENMVLNCIKNLPAKYRDIFMLKYSSEFTNTEIAEILELPEGTVRQRIARGKKVLEKSVTKLYRSEV